ncbi:MAG: aldehyde dehydrogenase family protein, partial [Moorea sp. SIO2B7]|nr:aldehyde dehydrogenase family protein [Moorena sp. SIO2B7]
ETTDLFLGWRPGLRIHGEASGKNSMVITPHADIDLAVADLVASAFGHGGQKCSAASLAICVGELYHSARFRRQLIDAVRSLEIGPATSPGTVN